MAATLVKSDHGLAKVLELIDEGLGGTAGRTTFTAGDVRDLLLDLRIATERAEVTITADFLAINWPAVTPSP